MADTLKVLGQVAPAATILTDLYTAPAGTQVVVSSIIICNRGSADAAVRVAVAVDGATDAPEQYLFHDVIVPAHDTLAAQIGITLGAQDVIRVQSDTGEVSFGAFGIEVV